MGDEATGEPSEPEGPKRHVKRTVGLLPLTFIASGGILGSGWLFSPQLTAQLAGPAALIAWGVGTVAMVLLANAYAEVAGVLPVPGGIARVPRFTHGDITAVVIGWTAWIGYSTQAPIEVAVMLQYAGHEWPWMFHGDPTAGSMTWAGLAVAAGFLVFFVIINAVGASFFARANTIITWTKFALPILVAITLLATYFSPANFTEYGGFAPFGARGVMEAVSAGGVVFALIGFRHAIDMAGEAKNPKTTVPLALLLGLLFPAVVYLLIQVAFIGALKPEHLAHGWANIHLAGRLGPIASVAATLGMSWLMASIYGAVVVAPIGGGLVATGSTSRLAYALSKNQFLPKWLEVLSKSHVPVRALWVNVVLGMVLLASLPFKGILTVNSAAITLSFVAGPLAVVALRKQMPHAKRSFKLPLLRTQALLGFVVATLIVYWSGWKTNVVLFGIIVFAVVFVGIKRLVFDKHPFKSLDRREAIWLAPYIATIMVVSYLGNFGGGRGILPVWWDVAVLSVLTCANFWLADWCRLSEEQARIYRHRHIDPEVVPHSDRHGPRPDLDEPG